MPKDTRAKQSWSITACDHDTRCMVHNSQGVLNTSSVPPTFNGKLATAIEQNWISGGTILRLEIALIGFTIKKTRSFLKHFYNAKKTSPSESSPYPLARNGIRDLEY